MSWDTEYLLEGLHTFGAPLNIWKWEVYEQPSGYQPLDYHRIHLDLDKDPALFSSLMAKMKKGSSINYFKRLIFMKSKHEGYKEHWFHNAWLYSLEREYRRSTYPFDIWRGTILGIAFDKTAPNVASLRNLGNRG